MPTKSYVVVRSHVNYEVIASPITSFGGVPGEGSFGVNEDRVKLGIVLKGFLERLIKRHLADGDFAGYRMYLNLQAWYLRGFPVSDAWTYKIFPVVFLPCRVTD